MCKAAVTEIPVSHPQLRSVERQARGQPSGARCHTMEVMEVQDPAAAVRVNPQL